MSNINNWCLFLSALDLVELEAEAEFHSPHMCLYFKGISMSPPGLVTKYGLLTKRDSLSLSLSANYLLIKAGGVVVDEWDPDYQLIIGNVLVIREN